MLPSASATATSSSMTCPRLKSAVSFLILNFVEYRGANNRQLIFQGSPVGSELYINDSLAPNPNPKPLLNFQFRKRGKPIASRN